MRRRGERAPKEKVAAAEEEAKGAGRKAEQGAEEYQCTGLLEQDFPELCARSGITGIPRVTLRPPPSFPEDEEPAEPTLPETLARIQRKFSLFQPCIQVARDPEDPRGVRGIFLRGWKIEEEMLGVLSQCLPALAGLQAVHLWKVGLTEQLLPALAALLARCPRLRTLSLEGNPLPEPAFHVLMGSDSTLVHLSLRNNSIGDAAARLIGQSLSRPGTANRSLASLVLSFNRISDLGASHIAEGLRLNRSLLSLSLANNNIGDAGATRLAKTSKEPESWSKRPSSQSTGTGPDKLLLGKHGKAPAKKKEPSRKEEARPQRKAPEPRVTRGRESRSSTQEKPSSEVLDVAEPLNPLLEEAREHRGSVVLPGNRALLNLNLTYNRVTERGLSAFVAALEGQRQQRPKGLGRQGLRCLSLERNRIPPDSPALARLQELLPPDAPPGAPQEEQEGGP
ncbi:leucine-rich repeat-containing protein 71 isoform X4 [Columba livia]|uniref:leucine-rich repeat-containing protein 71 isoform X4 n=1 Tax=Columba livia TaxID=8932 RepID=UPI0031BB8363